ncbi:MAG: septum formation inhibitor Maf [Firmicutes bacterium]|uniref:dTTP/UTP pyrophosphatase n=1 Tax=Candidatus Scybalomonas excrementavium TaxID=2840943 RepID=A0A9D9I0I7_9FIRM|nr:septum formation inhibitor Maf [Candidatus Scybalomonas excrementavium]
MGTLPVILASGSPRRREILEQVGIAHTVMVSEIDERITKSKPEQVVMELATQKSEDVASKVTEGVVIGADTVVAFDGNILGKPKSEEDAFLMLKTLSGCTHSVFTGVCMILKKDGATVDKSIFYEETKVMMCEMTKEEIEDYIVGKEPMDKAGAYGIQGEAGMFIERIDGDYYNVVGLPIAKVVQEMKHLLYK